MKRKIDLESDFEFFKGEIIGSVLMLNLKNNLMIRATNLEIKSTMLEYLDQLSRADAIKVLLIVSSPEKTGREEYCQFYDMVIQSALDISAVHKLFHAVDDLILKIKEINQIVIHADGGNVLPLFLNISLACDYRIVSDNTVFQNPCLEYGLVPKGGGAFFLSKILGASGALRLMLSEEDITAGEALKNAKRNRMGDTSYGKYNSAIYHLYGDPKLEPVLAAPSEKQSVSPPPADDLQGPPRTLVLRAPGSRYVGMCFLAYQQ